MVGWYHSHPRFMAEPSVADIENQRQYQTLFEDDAKDGPAPFVGLDCRDLRPGGDGSPKRF